MFSKAIIAAAAASVVAAQRPADTPICDYYTTALLKENNATNQYTLLTLLVNTAVIGNYTQPNMNAVPGILNPNATYEGRPVNLVPYFSGGLASTNRNGEAASVNFLDGGGAAPLMENKPANDENSRQYRLLTHLYQYFGALLGCSEYGNMGFPAYMGDTGMAEVHRFMALTADENEYFIQQVGLSAASFGVTEDDVTAVGKALTDTFNYRCAPAAAVLPKAEPELQAICQAEDCPISPNATCDAYPAVMKPAEATSPASGGNSSMDGTATMSAPAGATSTPASYTGSAAKAAAGVAAIGGAIFAAFL
ncbi:unnamed protein product [Zymoseptoria tritici ST99CH_1A5]|uniref:Heme haloperoxidase family profile domain-containing protein n=1 Tax=Zymoseptoria tritici ST99CH_1A5 TaxID=1276529 RepID=A0A1Y6LDU3_ZYMTR|nr:unnamed protein product [Zymoseptoria tritici ST99CH_1A5]